MRLVILKNRKKMLWNKAKTEKRGGGPEKQFITYISSIFCVCKYAFITWVNIIIIPTFSPYPQPCLVNPQPRLFWKKSGSVTGTCPLFFMYRLKVHVHVYKVLFVSPSEVDVINWEFPKLGINDLAVQLKEIAVRVSDVVPWFVHLISVYI